eukprot:gene35030-42421_t
MSTQELGQPTQALLECLIIDSNAIIRGHGLELYGRAKRIVTVPEVLQEIRDGKAKALLERLPFEIEVINPPIEIAKAVSDFSRTTGDYAALSKTDLKIIALTAMLERDIGMNDRIPKPKTKVDVSKAVKQSESAGEGVKVDLNKTAKPGVAWSNIVGKGLAEAVPEKATDEAVVVDADSPAAPFTDLDFPSLEASASTPYEEGDVDDENLDALEMELNNEHTFEPLRHDVTDSAEDANAPASAAPATDVSSSAVDALSSETEGLRLQHQEDGQDCHCADVAQAPAQSGAVQSVKQAQVTKPASSNTHSAILHISSHSQRGVTKEMREGGDNGLGWVNASNFSSKLASDIWTESSAVASQAAAKGSAKQKGKAASKAPAAKAEEVVTVACFTTDFSMQNVMLQLGLHIVSANGMLVKRVKKWVLRCMACYKIQGDDLTRLFCSECGAAHMSRVSVSIENGELKVHLKKDYKVNTRGMQYSLPAPGKQGRFNGELLLREDQLLSGIWRQKLVKINKDVKSAFGEDVTSDVGIQLNKQEGIQVGMGRINPNAQKGRERRGKSKRNVH